MGLTRCSISYYQIAYTPADDGESFYLSFTPTTPAIKSRTGESGCTADFISIPKASSSLDGEGICSVTLLFFTFSIFIKSFLF